MKKVFAAILALTLILSCTAFANVLTYVTTGKTNAFAGPGFDYDVITSLSKGTKLEIAGENAGYYATDESSNVWLYVYLSNGRTGWVSGSKLKAVSVNVEVNEDATDTACYLKTTAAITLRKSANDDSDALASVPKGTKLQVEKNVTDDDGCTWAQVSYDGKIGYVSVKYTTAIVPKQ